MKRKHQLFALTVLAVLLLLAVVLSLLFLPVRKDISGETNTNIAAVPSTEPVLPQNTNQIESFFSYQTPITVTYFEYDFSEGAENLEKVRKEIALSEDDGRALVDHLNIYQNNLSDDVLKSDFSVFYTVDISDELSLTIDADLENYTRDVFYMFVHRQKAGAFEVYGTYVDVTLIHFLEEKVNG